MVTFTTVSSGTCNYAHTRKPEGLGLSISMGFAGVTKEHVRSAKGNRYGGFLYDVQFRWLLHGESSMLGTCLR